MNLRLPGKQGIICKIHRRGVAADVKLDIMNGAGTGINFVDDQTTRGAKLKRAGIRHAGSKNATLIH